MLKYTLYLILVIFVCNTNIIAQKELPFYRHNLKIGRNLLNRENIQGARSFMGCDIFNAFPDTINKYIIFELRYKPNNKDVFLNSGYITRYNYNERKVIWTNKINKTSVLFSDSILFTNYSNKSHLINLNDGNTIWEKEISVISFPPDNKYALIKYNLKTPSRLNDSIYAFDITKQKRLWSCYLKDNNNITDINFLPDSTILITASGIHKIDLKNNKTWSFNANMTRKRPHIDNSIYFMAAIGGGLVGVLVVNIVANTVYNMNVAANTKTQIKSYTGVCSNILINDNRYFFASLDSIYNLNKEGIPIWRKPLPVDTTSTSVLYEYAKNLVLINTGQALAGIKYEKCGKPYIRIIRKETGELFFMNNIKVDTTIVDVKHNNDTITLLTNNKIIAYKIFNSTPITMDSISVKDYGKILGCVNQDLFILSGDSSKIIVNKLSTDIIYFVTNTGNYFKYSFGKKPEYIGNENNVFYFLRNYNNLNIFKSKNQTLISNSNFVPIGITRCGNKVFIMGDILYTTYDTYLQETDLKYFYKL